MINFKSQNNFVIYYNITYISDLLNLTLFVIADFTSSKILIDFLLVFLQQLTVYVLNPIKRRKTL